MHKLRELAAACRGLGPQYLLHACRGTGPEADQGAYAIVLAGGYADDEDEGTSFWYTGEGGQEAKGRQVGDGGGRAGGQGKAGELQGGGAGGQGQAGVWRCWRGRGLPGGHRSIAGDWKRWGRGGCLEAEEMQVEGSARIQPLPPVRAAVNLTSPSR